VFSARFELRSKKHLKTDAYLRQTVFSVRYELRPKKRLTTDAKLRETVFSVRYERRLKKDGGRCITETDPFSGRVELRPKKHLTITITQTGGVLCEVRAEAEETGGDISIKCIFLRGWGSVGLTRLSQGSMAQ
jgi:hypothetical protein